MDFTGSGGHKERHVLTPGHTTPKNAKVIVWLHQTIEFHSVCASFSLALLCQNMSKLLPTSLVSSFDVEKTITSRLISVGLILTVFSLKHVSYSAFLQFNEASCGANLNVAGGFFRCGVWGSASVSKNTVNVVSIICLDYCGTAGHTNEGVTVNTGTFNHQYITDQDVFRTRSKPQS